MSRPLIIDFHSFNKNLIETKIKIGHPETRNTVIMIPILHILDKPYKTLLIKTPKMYMPFKPKIQNQTGGYVRLSFDNIKIDNTVDIFYNFINDIDVYLENELLKTKIMNNKNIKYFQKTIKQADGFSDYFNLNFNLNETKVYDSQLNPININDVEGNFYAHFILELTGIYFNKQTKKMRVIWNLVQFKLDKIKNIIDECLFIDEEPTNHLEYHLDKIEREKREKDRGIKGDIHNSQVSFNSGLSTSTQTMIHNIYSIPNIPMKDNETLSKFYKMLSIGIPKAAVQHKMTLMNVDTRFLDYESDFNIYSLPDDLKKILIPIPETNSTNNNDIPTSPINSLFSSVNQFNKTKLKKVNHDDKTIKIRSQLSLMKKTMTVPTLDEIQEARKRLLEKKERKTNKI
jgi:hypothetical protein